MSARESSIVRSIFARLRSIPGVIARKRHGDQYSVAGDPDIYGLIKTVCPKCGYPISRHFEIEAKQEGENPEKIQEHRLRQWLTAGAVVGVARCAGDAERIVMAARPKRWL